MAIRTRNDDSLDPPAPAARRSRAASPSLVAAGKKLDTNRDAVKKEIRRRQQWQDEAWEYFDEVPEIKYSTWFLGNAMAKLRIFPACYPDGDPTNDPVSVWDDASFVNPQLARRAQDELDRIVLGIGQAELLRESNMNLEIAGEAYLVGLGPWEQVLPDPEDPSRTITVQHDEEWSIRSVSEIVEKEGAYAIAGSPGDQAPRVLDPERDTIIRLWQRHPRFSDLPDCNMRGVLSDCEALMLLTNQVKAEAKSRQSAGILLVPNELSFGDESTSTREDEGAEGTRSDPFEDALFDAVSSPIEDPSDAASVMPLVVRGPAEYLKPDAFRHLSLARDTADVLEDRIQKRIERIARGMNLPVEVVMGHQQTTFANASQVDEDTFEDHLEPRCVLLADAFTVGFLVPQLLDAGVDPVSASQVFVWYDASDLIEAQDPAESADVGLDRGTISEEAWRKAKGWTEDDAPEPLELLIRSGLRRGILTADLTKALLELLGISIDVEPLPVAPPADAPATDAQAAAVDLVETARLLAALRGRTDVGALVAAPGVPTDRIGGRLTAIDRDLRSRVIVAADRAMTRALERAGNRLKSKAGPTRALLKNKHPLYAAATLGPALVAEAGYSADLDLFDNERWDELATQFEAWVSRAQDDALRTLGAFVGGFSDAEVEHARVVAAHDRAHAWEWMKGALDRLAAHLLYKPDPLVAAGELDPTVKVPAGLVRGALARAGGAEGLETVGDDTAFVNVLPGEKPTAQVATGPRLMALAADHGVTVEGYQWVYGPAFRAHPFEEHVALDGQVFTNFDGPELASTSDWLPFGHYMPGDHAGCQCDFELVLVHASGEVTRDA